MNRRSRVAPVVQPQLPQRGKQRPNGSSGIDPVQGTLVQVDRMYYDENLPQQNIADRLGVSRSLIAHYLKRARDAGIVRIQIVEPTTHVRIRQLPWEKRPGSIRSRWSQTLTARTNRPFVPLPPRQPVSYQSASRTVTRSDWYGAGRPAWWWTF